jgi:hypothetical protein
VGFGGMNLGIRVLQRKIICHIYLELSENTDKSAIVQLVRQQCDSDMS